MDGTAGVVTGSRRGWLPWAIALLWIIALGVTVAAPTLLSNESAAWYRFWRSLPGIVDVCGTPTPFARSIPPLLALTGAGLTFLLDGSRRVVLVARTAGVVLTIALTYAVTQNVALGQRLCIID